jgi:Glycosyl hydrolase family 115/Gylcosyl hydrolase family 115 C-terminal domain
MQNFLLFSLALLLFTGCGREQEQSRNLSFIVEEPASENLALAVDGRSAPILCSEEDYKGVLIALNNLQADFARVTTKPPELLLEKEQWGRVSENAIIIGTIGESPLIDGLIREGRLNVDEISGKWESSLTTLVNNPLPGIALALVIAGSDKRGTIFGIYELSKQIGVSPWYYWADVSPRKKNSLYAIPGRFVLGEPAVKYRGIFINDEAPALSGWAFEKFGGFNHDFYEHVFELILRMKGNYLWPAMWGRAFYDDDPENARLADEYGVVIGTTHHEPLMRAHVEWERYGNGPWDYTSNSDTLRSFWRKGIERMGNNESIVSLGMRGDGDEPMTEGTAIELLEDIVREQRNIIEDVSGKPASETPQLWALYKEVQEYYDRGMRVPDDVTLLLCDDNWGNIRKLPRPGKDLRSGGYGIYYHFDYVGDPRNYKWLNTNQIERIWEQMHQAYEFGADRIWIVNVGDIKPMELPTQFFLDYAWDPGSYKPENLEEYYIRWATQQFGPAFAEPVAEILAAYTKFNSRRKHELLAPGTYSLSHYREAERVLNEYRELVDLAEFLYKDIPEELKDAFYQLVLFPVEASCNLNELYVAAAMNNLYATQGRAATNEMAEKVRQLFHRDSLLTEEYHNLGHGKWNHMMSQTHIGYTYWQQPEQNNMPEVLTISVPNRALMGVALEQSTLAWPESDQEAILPLYDAQNRQEYYLEIFNRGSLEFNCSIVPGVDWIIPSADSFTLYSQERIWVSVDWEKIPDGKQSAFVEVIGPDNLRIPVMVKADNRKLPALWEDRELFIADRGMVSMEAAHFQRAIEDRAVKWTVIPNLGRSASAMISLPVSAPPSTPGENAPRLEYDFYVPDTGSYEISFYLSPTLNYHNNEGLCFAVSLDDGEKRTINMHEGETKSLWRMWVSDNINRQNITVEIGEAGIHTLQWWRIDAGIVLQKVVIRKKGSSDPSYLGPPESLLVNREEPLPH